MTKGVIRVATRGWPAISLATLLAFGISRCVAPHSDQELASSTCDRLFTTIKDRSLSWPLPASSVDREDAEAVLFEFRFAAESAEHDLATVLRIWCLEDAVSRGDGFSRALLASRRLPVCDSGSPSIQGMRH